VVGGSETALFCAILGAKNCEVSKGNMRSYSGTYASAWVDWELLESAKKGNKMIVMALKDGKDVTEVCLPAYFQLRDNRFWYWNPVKLRELIEND